MNPWAAGALIIGLSALASTVMLLLRRRAPAGGYFADSDRASGVLGLIGTSYAVLLAFVIFLAFESYDTARQAAGVEAVAVREMDRTAGLFGLAEERAFHSQLLCYSRAVVADEWPLMAGGSVESPLVNRWLDEIQGTLEQLRVPTPRAESALSHFLDTWAERQQGRRARLAEAAPFVPPLVWVVLGLGGLMVVLFVLAYADPNERRTVQVLKMSGAVVTVVSGLLIVVFLDRPYSGGGSSLQPTGMLSSIAFLENQRESGDLGPELCDANGQPR